jgi:ABC-type Fe3+-hydroxamate transport system substrate-binding protein
VAFRPSRTRSFAVAAVCCCACAPVPPARVGVATRIVSLSPAFTELLFAIGAGDRVVGRTRWGDYPPAASAVPSVGDGLAPNVEAVAARRPDLVVLYAASANATAESRLADLGIRTVTLAMDRLADVPVAARRLGALTGQQRRADSLAAAFAAALDSARRAVTPAPNRRLLLLTWDQPPVVIAGGSFQHELVTLAGAENVFGDLPEPSAQVTIEIIAQRDPDFVLLMSGSREPDWADRPEWRAVRAVREHRFIRVEGSEFARPSLRALDAVRKLRAALEAAS